MISSHDKSNVNMPGSDWISGMAMEFFEKLDIATFVLSIRSMELKQKGVPSRDI